MKQDVLDVVCALKYRDDSPNEKLHLNDHRAGIAEVILKKCAF